MNQQHSQNGIKVYYTPIEAAIRWAELLAHEASILSSKAQKSRPTAILLAQWPVVALNIDRLFDAMRHGELPYGKGGITHESPGLLDSPDLTIRHVDLKRWLSETYPNQKPTFLFDEIEQRLHSNIDRPSVQALLQQIQALQAQIDAYAQRPQTESVETRTRLSSRAETTYLNIIGGLLTLLLGQSPSGVRYSAFNTLESIISALIAYHNGRPGITERTLSSKFAQAKRQLSGQ